MTDGETNMTTLAYYLDVKRGQANAIAAISAKLDDPDLKMADFALMVRAVEVMENIDDEEGYAALLARIAVMAADLYSPDLKGEDILMLTRAAKLGDVPFGAEERWMLMNRDERNIDIGGDVMIGERTFGSFGDRHLETFYSEI